jgi:branched-chain amino acid transport system substrate-binding protein
MGDRVESSGGRRGLVWRSLAGASLGALLVAATACGDDGNSGDGSEAAAGVDVQELLGPENQATGDPVRIGMVSDGATQAFDSTDELRAAEATAEYWNTHRGGVSGHPIEVVTCETGGDPAGATDCANQMVEEDVVAVALSQSAVGTLVWEPLHAAGVPTMWFSTTGQEILLDQESSFVLINPLTLFGLPVSVAESEGADKIVFVTIDVPEAIQGIEALAPTILPDAGLDYDVVPIPPGTADMTSQMQQVVAGDPGVVHISGNDAFCIAALNGLNAVGYDGPVTTLTQCITDATREAVPGDVLQGTFIGSTAALGATDDPTFQLYEAVIDAFGDDVEDVNKFTSMGGYVAMASLLTSLDGISGDVTPQAVVATIKAMPETELPGGGGLTFRCGGSAIDLAPAVCSNEWLRTTLDAEGRPTTYEVVDSTDILPE